MARKILWLVAVSVLATAVPAAADSSWGVVDMGRLQAEYEAMQNLQQQFDEFQMEQEKRLEERHKTRLLQDDERQEFLDLSQVAAPTEERSQRLEQLAGLSDQRERRRFDLRKQEERTEVEEAELKELDALYDKRMEELAALQADVLKSRQAKWEELTKLLTESVNDAVKTVAEEKKLTIVVRKDTVLFGGVDITSEVLATLNAPEPASA
jgi:outer membrane protein